MALEVLWASIAALERTYESCIFSMLKRSADPRDEDWSKLASFQNQVFRKAFHLRTAAQECPTDLSEYFNPNECLIPRKRRQTRTVTVEKTRQTAQTRSFDRLYPRPKISAMLKDLTPVRSFRASLKSLLSPKSRRAALQPLPDTEPSAKEFTTFDLGAHSHNLLPILEKVAPRVFPKSVPRHRLSEVSIDEEYEAVRRFDASQISPPRFVNHSKRWVDKSLQNARSRAPQSDIMKEWEIRLSTYATLLRRKRESRRR